MTFAELIAAVRSEGGFDTSTTGTGETEVKRWLNQAYRRMVAHSRYRKAEQQLATTVVDQAEYALSDDAVELLKLKVGDAPYRPVGQGQLWDLKVGDLRLGHGVRGVFCHDYSSAAVKQVEIYPAPSVAGTAITGLVALYPTALVNPGDLPIVPEDFHEALVDGAIGIGMRRTEEDHAQAQPYDDRLMAEAEKLRLQLNTRVGSGPTQMRVAGYHLPR